MKEVSWNKAFEKYETVEQKKRKNLNRLSKSGFFYAVDKNKNLVAIGPTLFDYNIDWSQVDKFQIFQDTVGFLTFKIKFYRGLTNTKDLLLNMQNILTKIFDNFSIKLVEVNDLQFTRIGKFRYVDQKLNMREYAAI